MHTPHVSRSPAHTRTTFSRIFCWCQQMKPTGCKTRALATQKPTKKTEPSKRRAPGWSLEVIVKDIEKYGVNPTKAMMELLFEHAPQQNKQQKSSSSNIQKIPAKDDAFFKSAFETIELQKENTIIKQNLEQLQQQFTETLEKVEVTKSSFGSPKLHLKMKLEEYNHWKIALKQSEPCTSVLPNSI